MTIIEETGPCEPVCNNEDLRARGCRWFLELYSEFRDARLDKRTHARAATHLVGCSSCRRYDRVVRKGVNILRNASPAASTPYLGIAFLRDRAMIAERESRALGTAGSGVTFAAAVVVAMLLLTVAWLPILSSGTPQVELQPVVAAAPPQPAPSVLFPLSISFPLEARRTDRTMLTPAMLFEYGRTPASPGPRATATGPDLE